MFRRTDDLRITRVRPLIPPAILLEEIPITERASNVVSDTRQAIANALDRRDPNRIANSQHDVTDTCLGEAAVKAWKANGSPSKEPLKTKEYIADIFMAPLSVKAPLEHGEGKCNASDFLVEMGVEIVDETL